MAIDYSIQSTELFLFDQWQILGIIILSIAAGILFPLIAILWKRKLGFGEVNPNQFSFVMLIAMIIIFVVFAISEQSRIYIMFIIPFFFSYWMSVFFFNLYNEHAKMQHFIMFDVPEVESTGWQFYAFRKNEFDKQLTAIELNEWGKEPFMNLLKRMFGLEHRTIEVKNKAIVWKYNKKHELTIVRGMDRDVKGNYTFVGEPSLVTSIVVFFKLWEGHFTLAEELERKDEQLMIYRLMKNILAKRETWMLFRELCLRYAPDLAEEYEKEMRGQIKSGVEKEKQLEEKLRDMEIKHEEELKDLLKKTKEQSMFDKYDISPK